MSGKQLDSKLIKDARTEELIEFRKHGVYDKVPLRRCFDETGPKCRGVKRISHYNFITSSTH